MKKREIRKAVRRIEKDIRAINKKILKKEDSSKITRNYELKKAIKNYYQQNKHKIHDDVLVKMYDQIFQPSIAMEISIGVLSGMIASLMLEFILKLLPVLSFDTVLNGIVSAILCVIFVIIVAAVFAWMLLWAYRQIRSFHSYSEEVNDYYKSYLKELIEEQESKLNKEAANEQRSKSKNRKHK